MIVFHISIRLVIFVSNNGLQGVRQLVTSQKIAAIHFDGSSFGQVILPNDILSSKKQRGSLVADICTCAKSGFVIVSRRARLVLPNMARDTYCQFIRHIKSYSANHIFWVYLFSPVRSGSIHNRNRVAEPRSAPTHLNSHITEYCKRVEQPNCS